MAEQIKPLNPMIACIWDHDSSDYPDRIKVPMSNGRIVTYTRDPELPHPCFEAAMKNIRNLEGYKHG